MARLACALVVVGCGSVATIPEPPEPAMVIGEQGWCGTRPWHRAVGSRDGVITFAVATATLADVPRIEHPTFENGDKGWCCHDTARIAYAFTADALIVLDAKTLVERWRVPGEVHGVLMPDNGSSDAAFLRIDRTGPQPRAVLDVRSQARHVPGPILRSRVVYQGPTIIDAGLRIVDSTYEVTIAPR